MSEAVWVFGAQGTTAALPGCSSPPASRSGRSKALPGTGLIAAREGDERLDDVVDAVALLHDRLQA